MWTDTHKDVDSQQLCLAAPPWELRGGAKARPITLGQLRPLNLECPEHGMAGVKLGAG